MKTVGADTILPVLVTPESTHTHVIWGHRLSFVKVDQAWSGIEKKVDDNYLHKTPENINSLQKTIDIEGIGSLDHILVSWSNTTEPNQTELVYFPSAIVAGTVLKKTMWKETDSSVQFGPAQ